ncbi:MAG TPA: hypothetical protein VJ867_16515 [Gemmatimonadaceae bacterium]|nr:hypothetical protein [Gemmatimonadaceae bacterium]
MLVACSGGSAGTKGATAAPSSAVSSTPAAPVAGAAGPHAAGCPHTGLWSSCTVLERLDRAGLAPRADSGQQNIPPFTAPAQRLHVSTSDLDIFIYHDAEARAQDERRLDRSKFVEYDAPLGMQPLPTIIRSANLIAVLHSRNDHQRERVSDALTAGPPQP